MDVALYSLIHGHQCFWLPLSSIICYAENWQNTSPKVRVQGATNQKNVMLNILIVIMFINNNNSQSSFKPCGLLWLKII
jgi:hypothetical protein